MNPRCIAIRPSGNHSVPWPHRSPSAACTLDERSCEGIQMYLVGYRTSLVKIRPVRADTPTILRSASERGGGNRQVPAALITIICIASQCHASAVWYTAAVTSFFSYFCDILQTCMWRWGKFEMEPTSSLYSRCTLFAIFLCMKYRRHW